MTLGAVRLSAILLAITGGCSWLTVVPPPAAPSVAQDDAAAEDGAADDYVPLRCTRTRSAPRTDVFLASFFGVVAAGGITLGTVGVVASADDGDEYNRFMSFMFLGAGLVYAGIATPFVFSARSGYRDVAACRAAYLRRYGIYH
jgi:hypothetical protein